MDVGVNMCVNQHVGVNSMNPALAVVNESMDQDVSKNTHQHISMSISSIHILHHPRVSGRMGIKRIISRRRHHLGNETAHQPLHDS